MIYSVYWESFRRGITGVGNPFNDYYAIWKQKEYKNYFASGGSYLTSAIASCLPKGTVINMADPLKEHLDTNKDSFVFIITSEQMDGFNSYVKQHDLEKYIAVKVGPLNNENYPNRDPRLTLIVMAGPEHLIRKTVTKE